MDIRTKLVFALVAVALGSMLILGIVGYSATREMMQDGALRQLDAVAESRKRDLAKVIVAWRDRAQLIASRTQLRLSLQALVSGEGDVEKATARIQRILDDARASVRSVRRIAVLRPDGSLVATTPGNEPAAEPPGADAMAHLHLHRDGELRVTLDEPLSLRGERIGSMRVELSALELENVTANDIGLGRTGETLIVRLDPETGAARVLNPLRHDAGAAMKRTIRGTRETSPTIAAAHGEERVFADGTVDYRGEPVWAATRFVPAAGWGVVVKVDRAEQQAAVMALRDRLVTLGLSIAAFAILIGTLLGIWFSKPIRELAEVARRIRDGELHLRARCDSEDEVGELADAFNHMTAALITSRDFRDPASAHEEEDGPSTSH